MDTVLRFDTKYLHFSKTTSRPIIRVMFIVVYLPLLLFLIAIYRFRNATREFVGITGRIVLNFFSIFFFSQYILCVENDT